MPDITLCADKCDTKTCVRHPAQYKDYKALSRYQSYANFKGTEKCLKKNQEETHGKD